MLSHGQCRAHLGNSKLIKEYLNLTYVIYFFIISMLVCKDCDITRWLLLTMVSKLDVVSLPSQLFMSLRAMLLPTSELTSSIWTSNFDESYSYLTAKIKYLKLYSWAQKVKICLSQFVFTFVVWNHLRSCFKDNNIQPQNTSNNYVQNK